MGFSNMYIWKKNVGAGLVLLAVFLLWLPVCKADSTSDKAISGQEGVAYQVESKIVQKRPRFVVTDAGQKFMVSLKTEILEFDGDSIDLRYLEIPCKAEIVFTGPRKGVFHAARIMVIEAYSHGNSRWSPPQPR